MVFSLHLSCYVFICLILKILGLYLFQVDSSETQNALFNTLRQNENAPSTLRIDGLRNEAGDNNWYYYDFGKTPAFSGLAWLSSSNTAPEYCSLVTTNNYRNRGKKPPSYKIDGLQNSTEVAVLCQYESI